MVFSILLFTSRLDFGSEPDDDFFAGFFLVAIYLSLFLFSKETIKRSNLSARVKTSGNTQSRVAISV